MFCESCGSQINDGQAFCSNCGAPAKAAPAANPAAAPAAAATPVMAAQPVASQPVAPQPAYQQPVYQQPVTQPVYQPVAQPVLQQPVYAAQPTVVVQQPVYAKPAAPRGNGPATAGLTFGILTLVFFWSSYFTYVFGLLGLIFSIIGLVKKNAPGKKKAVAGLILTGIGSVLAAVMIEFFWAALGMVWDAALNEVYEDLESEIYSTSYSDTDTNSGTGLEEGTFYIDGDFATTEKGYSSGVLHIDGFIVEF